MNLCHVTGSQVGCGDRQESVRLLVREGLKVEVTPRRVECSREGIRRRVYGCPSLVGGGTCDSQWAGSLLR